MIETLYLAECSKTYRQWIPRLVKGYVRKVVDLWEFPETSLESDSSNLLVVDEAFLSRGQGPICTVIASLLEPRRIVTLPILVLRRREALLRELSPRVFQLRRPFYASELEAILGQFCPEGRVLEEVKMSEDSYSDSEGTGDRPVANEKTAAPEIDAATLEKITREAIEKVVREMVPQMAEKIVREEIERLTS